MMFLRHWQVLFFPVPPHYRPEQLETFAVEIVFFWCSTKIAVCLLIKLIFIFCSKLKTAKYLRVHWKFSLDKINGTKNALVFLLLAPAHHNFSFKLRLLCELKHKVRLSKTLCGISHFWFSFTFIRVYNFVQQKTWTPWL